MTEHGIHTCKSPFWIHFHPLELRGAGVYWFAVSHCREHIARHKLVVQLGRSKDADRTATGAGYLIPKASLFVTRQPVPEKYVKEYPWADMTDREAGLCGARCVELMMMKREILLPDRQLRPLNGRADQFNGCDCELIVGQNLIFEIKTERVISPNLFVQSGEHGHRVNFTPGGAERITDIEGFAEDES